MPAAGSRLRAGGRAFYVRFIPLSGTKRKPSAERNWISSFADPAMNRWAFFCRPAEQDFIFVSARGAVHIQEAVSAPHLPTACPVPRHSLQSVPGHYLHFRASEASAGGEHRMACGHPVKDVMGLNKRQADMGHGICGPPASSKLAIWRKR